MAAALLRTDFLSVFIIFEVYEIPGLGGGTQGGGLSVASIPCRMWQDFAALCVSSRGFDIHLPETGEFEGNGRSCQFWMNVCASVLLLEEFWGLNVVTPKYGTLVSGWEPTAPG